MNSQSVPSFAENDWLLAWYMGMADDSLLLPLRRKINP